MAGDARGAWGVIEAAQAAGADVDEVYLDLVAPAMVSIGRRWESGELDVAVEHRASVIAGRLVGRLGHRFLRRGRNRGTVVLGAPAGERHALRWRCWPTCCGEPAGTSRTSVPTSPRRPSCWPPPAPSN